MKCHKCKHNAEIARLRDICSKCELGDKCAVSDSVSLDTIHDGTLDRVVRVAPNHQTAYTFDPGTIDDPAAQEKPATIAELSDEEGEKLRAFLFRVMGLSPLLFVAALHFARRGGRRRLAGVIRDFAAHVRAYCGKGPSKATVSAKWKSLKAKIPELAAVGTLAKGNGGPEAGSVE